MAANVAAELDSGDDNSSGSSVGMPTLEDQEDAPPPAQPAAAAGGELATSGASSVAGGASSVGSFSGGMRTASITWTTPLVARTSARTTLAPLIAGGSTVTLTSEPWTVGTSLSVRSVESPLPDTTW